VDENEKEVTFHERPEPEALKRRHFQVTIILLCVYWYLRYALSYRYLEEIMLERDLQVDHITIQLPTGIDMQASNRTITFPIEHLGETNKPYPCIAQQEEGSLLW
jgi:hypothetical protein